MGGNGVTPVKNPVDRSLSYQICRDICLREHDLLVVIDCLTVYPCVACERPALRASGNLHRSNSVLSQERVYTPPMSGGRKMDLIDIGTASQWAALVTAVGGAWVAIARSWSKVNVANKSDDSSFKIQNGLLENLRDEIKRLEAIINLQNVKIAELSAKIDSIKTLEIDGSKDFGALEQIVKIVPCQACQNQGDAFLELKDVVGRMANRRKSRLELIEEAAQ